MATKTRKRRTSNPVKEDLRNIVLIIIALAVIAVVWTAITILIYAITFWYITAPALICTAYVWLKTRTNTVQQPKPTRSTIDTIEETKTNQGTKKVHTIENYDPDPKLTDQLFRFF